MCPLCRSKKVRVSHPRLWDFLFLILQARPMRCRVCHYRFYRWPWSRSGMPSRPVEAPPKLTAFKPQRRKAATAAGGKG
jgi:hypothetical protein